jgi:ankyrin repeat protein
MEKVIFCKRMDLKFTTEAVKAKSNTPCLPFVSPVDLLQTIIPQGCCNGNNDAVLHIPPTEDEINSYTMEAVQAIRANDLAKLRELLATGHSLDAANSNGEYLVHLAVRRSNLETVRVLVDHAHVDVNVRDNMGRTILHDVCWKSSPDVALMDMLLPVVSPELLLARDHRGHCAFDYARKEHWPTWNSFLQERKDLISERVVSCREQLEQDDCSSDISDYYDDSCSDSDDDEMDSDEE